MTLPNFGSSSHDKIQPQMSGKLPEIPLKTLLAHQNEHRQQKKGRVAFLEFNFEHFKG